MSNEGLEYTGALELTSARSLWLLESDSCTEPELWEVCAAVSQPRAATDVNLCLYPVQAG